MNNLRQAAQQALEALEERYVGALRDKAIDALEAALAEPEQEPMATWENKYGMKEWEVHAIRAGWMPAPTPRKPLTDEEVRKHLAIAKSHEQTWLMFARAIERAHGIGEQK